METFESNDVFEALSGSFVHKPTQDQLRAFEALGRFLTEPGPDRVFMLKGYAGTGKTSLIKSLVSTLPRFKMKAVLMAPTGRAAKVMAQYTGKRASTIHRHIYSVKSGRGGMAGFSLKANKAVNTIYIVDEASMIGEHDQSGQNRSLLSDLIQYVSDGLNCKLILVGDIGQLPPVGSDRSPALDPEHLRFNYNLETLAVTMTEVMRQDRESQILSNATTLRDHQRNSDYSFPALHSGGEVASLKESFDVEDALNDSYREAGREGTIIIVRSNKRANLYNQQIRMRILWQDERISAGDFLMVVKNNYFWLPPKSKAGFIANGDTLEILEILEFKQLYGYDFARVIVRMVDYPDEPTFEVILNLNVLDLEAAALSWGQMGKLYERVEEDYRHIGNRFKRRQKMRNDPYLNALQVKFAYAITCHKSQGGQWENVFIEKPWYPNNQLALDDFRWLYTAFTRAQRKLFLLGFGEEFFPD